MKKVLKQSLLLLLFWFLLFALNRICFFIGVAFLLKQISLGLIFQSFYHALRLDLSMAGYLCLFPFLFTAFYTLYPHRFWIRIIDGLTIFFIVVVNLTAVGEMCLYREWKAKLSMQALEHFIHPSEVFKSASVGLTILFFTLSILFSWLGIRIYRKKISLNQIHPPKGKISGSFFWKSALFLAVSITFCGLSIRGGIQEIPIQCSDAFFCTEPVVNDGAVNPLWNLSFSIMDYENRLKKNPYKYFDQKEADNIARELYTETTDSSHIFLTTVRPNLVFILLESWSAYGVKSFGGNNFAPFTDSLSRRGIRFTRLYPAGYVSDQGIAAVLSGYPCVSRNSILNQSSKSVKLPCINEDLKAYGYQGGFIFGGDLNYGNIRSYIFNKKFDVVKEEKDFGSSIPRGKLGIQDGPMADQFLLALNTAKAPFVYMWFTLSSHMPYDFPGVKVKLTSLENEYSNSITYSDKALKQFFNKARNSNWYKNTLFVVLSDHSHGSHKDFSVYEPEYHRIPMFFFGDVIKPEYRGKEITAVFSQLDIVKTLLRQMNMEKEAEQYVWSKDMFRNGIRNFAYFCHHDGAGMVGNDGFIGYQNGVNRLIYNSFGENNPKADSLTRLSKAFQQSVYEDYRLK